MTERMQARITGGASLRPKAGFNWMAVSWGGPSEPLVRSCSYCDAEIAEDDVPMIMWTSEGFCARFCADCQSRWWGLL